MRKYTISFAEGQPFNSFLQTSSNSFLNFNNFDKILNFSKNSIGKGFYESHKHILDQKRGCGYWLWKPYFLKRVFDFCNEGDVVMYRDSAIMQIKDLSDIINVLLERNNILNFTVNDGNGEEREITKRDCFILLDCDNEKFWTGELKGQVNAAYSFFVVNNFTYNFVSTWLEYCKDERILTDKPSTLGENYSMFIDHRHDQSIFSLLCKKNNIKPIVDITQFGNPYRTTPQYLMHMRG